MPADATYIWSEDRSSRGINGWNATRAWLVHGTANRGEAEQPPVTGHPPIAQIGESHPLSGSLRCNSIDSQNQGGPLTWKVVANYTTEQGGFGDPGEDPLRLPPKIMIDWDVSSDVMDVDAYGIPIQNTAGFPFDSDPTDELYDIAVTVTRNEPYYDIPKALYFTNKTNLGPYTIPNVGSITDGQALRAPPRLLTEYTPTSTYVTVAYTLRLRERGWRTRIKNHGRQGWAASGNWGDFVNSAGDRSSTEVLLNAVGQPVDSNVKVLIAKAAVDAVMSPKPLPPDDYIEPFTADKQSGDPDVPAGYYLKFRRKRSVSFEGLL